MPTFYIETSAWGSLARRQPADRKRIVRRFLSLLDGTRGAAVISTMVFTEISRAPSAEAGVIMRQITSMQPVVFPITEAVETLARAYLSAGVLPATREADAIHVAVATCFGSDYLVSWNHRHLTRPRKRLQYGAVNQLNGYLKTPFICNPVEAYDELRGG